MHPTAGAGRLPLQTHDEIHHTPRLRTAVQQVTRDNQMSLGTDPGKTVVDDTRYLKRRDQGIVCAMNITDRDDSLDIRKMPFIRLRE